LLSRTRIELAAIHRPWRAAVVLTFIEQPAAASHHERVPDGTDQVIAQPHDPVVFVPVVLQNFLG